MSLLEKITDALQASPDLKAKQLSRALQEERGTINNLLHSNQDRFIQNDDFTWRLRPETPKAVPHRRPGPFGPARELLPEGQQIEVMSGDTPCHIALGRMMELNISTIPIRDERGHITGVFTWSAFSKRAQDSATHTRSISSRSAKNRLRIRRRMRSFSIPMNTSTRISIGTEMSMSSWARRRSLWES